MEDLHVIFLLVFKPLKIKIHIVIISKCNVHTVIFFQNEHSMQREK